MSAETRQAIRAAYVWGERRHGTCIAGIAEKFGVDIETVERIVNSESAEDEEHRAAVSKNKSRAMQQAWKRRALLAALETRP
jgi:transposase